MQSNQTIKTNYFLIKPMPFSNLRLHLTTTRSSTFSGFNLALLGVTTLPATEKTRSDLDEAAGIGKTTLTILDRRGNWASWCLHHSNWSTEDSSSGSSWKDLHSSNQPHHSPVQSNTSTAQYSQVQPIPEPDPKPELFGQTRPEPDPKSKSPTRQSLPFSWTKWSTSLTLPHQNMRSTLME